VGAIITRVVADARAAVDPFDGLRRIGIDEISYKRGYKFLTVVVDHDSGRLVWAAPGKERATLEAFFAAFTTGGPLTRPPLLPGPAARSAHPAHSVLCA
jgi:transposase